MGGTLELDINSGFRKNILGILSGRTRLKRFRSETRLQLLFMEDNVLMVK